MRDIAAPVLDVIDDAGVSKEDLDPALAVPGRIGGYEAGGVGLSWGHTRCWMSPAECEDLQAVAQEYEEEAGSLDGFGTFLIEHCRRVIGWDTKASIEREAKPEDEAEEEEVA